LSPGGVLIVDDYGCWMGSKKATDEYVAANCPGLVLVPLADGGEYYATKE
jgi:hypothetical protein